MKYTSIYSPGKEVYPAQIITEKICEHKAGIDDCELPNQPWKLVQTDEWKKYFKQQIPAAHKLLKEFDERDILAALNRRDAKHIYSLRNPYLKILIKQEKEKREKRETIEPPKISSTLEQPKTFHKKTKLDLLEEL